MDINKRVTDRKVKRLNNTQNAKNWKILTKEIKTAVKNDKNNYITAICGEIEAHKKQNNPQFIS